MTASYRETVIDGYNLIHKLPKPVAGKPMEERRQVLETLLARYRLKTRRHVTVVYDGGRGAKPLRSAGAIEIIFSGSLQTADHWIIDHVRRSGSRAGVTLVVSSDREIQRNAIAWGAKCVDADTFLNELDAMGITLSGSGKNGKRPHSDTRKERKSPLSDTEVDYWLRLFTPGK